MHTPKKFQQQDEKVLLTAIRKYPFANLITHTVTGIEANHIPLYLNQSNGKPVLQGHIARTNSLWKNVTEKTPVLAIFNGPSCYVSPNYYPSKMQTGRAVPTWNYVAVHAHGMMSCIHDKQWNLAMLDNLTAQHEAQQPQPWSTADAPPEYIQQMLGAIVGLQIDSLAITGQWKLSQNQPSANQQGVIAGLGGEQHSAAHEIAQLVKEYAQP